MRELAAVAAAIAMIAVIATGAVARGQTPEAMPGGATQTATAQDPQLQPPPPAPRTLQSWDEALALVRAQSPDYRATYDAVRRAEAQSRVALAALLPSASAMGTFTHQFFTASLPFGGATVTYPPQNVWGLGGTLTWTPLNPAALHARGTAERAVDAAQSDLAEERRTIAQSVVSSMLATLAAERVAELNRVGLRAALDRLALAQAKARYGSGTALDIDRADQDVAAARAQVITGDEALRESREALGLALGSPVPIAAPGSLDLVDFERAVASTCRMSSDVEQRADVVAARRRLEITERAVDEARLRWAPTLGVQSQATWASQVFFPPATLWSLEGVLTVPIWDGGATYGYVRDAAAAADQARLALVKTRLAALVNVAQATRAVEVARASLEVARRQQELALRIDQRTRDGYMHGLGTSLDLVTSAQALRQAEIDVALLRFQASQARVMAVLANATCVY